MSETLMLKGRIRKRRRERRPKKRWMDGVTIVLERMGVEGWRNMLFVN